MKFKGKGLKVLVIGSGGREHAIAWKLAQSPDVEMIYVAPGNAGTAHEPKVCNVPVMTDVSALANFAKYEGISFTVVGPEAPLAAGIVDHFRNRGLKIFGPTQAATQLESSKLFAKSFMSRHNIPTARYCAFSSAKTAHEHVDFRSRSVPMVVKANGLAAGKGAFVCKTKEEAHAAIDEMAALGEAGEIIIVEDFVSGEEASFIVMVDGEHALPLATSQDHKRLRDGDEGPNTGGMGAISPAPVITADLHDRIMCEIIMPTVRGMAEENIPYTGFLYAGLMIDAKGNPIVLEFNCRLGDPETQPILLRLKSDLAELMEHTFAGTLDQVYAEWDGRVAVGVVLAADGYPNTPRKGIAIERLSEDDQVHKVFHAGTAKSGSKLVTSGGRVMCATALGVDICDARWRAYEMVGEIYFDGMQFRRDIGHHAISRETAEVV